MASQSHACSGTFVFVTHIAYLRFILQLWVCNLSWSVVWTMPVCSSSWSQWHVALCQHNQRRLQNSSVCPISLTRLQYYFRERCHMLQSLTLANNIKKLPFLTNQLWWGLSPSLMKVNILTTCPCTHMVTNNWFNKSVHSVIYWECSQEEVIKDWVIVFFFFYDNMIWQYCLWVLWDQNIFFFAL